uniref:Uncharacterized protein n=1 Tax=Triticum urartu TaxID=4572 RepID=A0A8R7K465_TRIUA
MADKKDSDFNSTSVDFTLESRPGSNRRSVVIRSEIRFSLAMRCTYGSEVNMVMVLTRSFFSAENDLSISRISSHSSSIRLQHSSNLKAKLSAAAASFLVLSASSTEATSPTSSWNFDSMPRMN